MTLLRLTLCALRSGTHFDLLTGRKRLEGRGGRAQGRGPASDFESSGYGHVRARLGLCPELSVS